jgi:hypothetical protein
MLLRVLKRKKNLWPHKKKEAPVSEQIWVTGYITRNRHCKIIKSLKL